MVQQSIADSVGCDIPGKAPWLESAKLDVHGSMHHNINLIEITNKMQPCSRIYYFSVS